MLVELPRGVDLDGASSSLEDVLDVDHSVLRALVLVKYRDAGACGGGGARGGGQVLARD